MSRESDSMIYYNQILLMTSIIFSLRLRALNFKYEKTREIDTSRLNYYYCVLVRVDLSPCAVACVAISRLFTPVVNFAHERVSRVPNLITGDHLDVLIALRDRV